MLRVGNERYEAMSDKNNIRDAADAVKGVLEATPIYQDGIQPAAKEVGKALGTVASSINTALMPLRMLVWGMDKIEDWLKSTLEEKLKDVPPERIQTPKANIAGPVIEAMRFAGDEPDLRDMYANLLATSMDKETADYAHPAFVEIIKQIKPDEAKMVSRFEDCLNFPIVSIDIKLADGGSVVFLDNISSIGIQAGISSPFTISANTSNLVRLGLLTIQPFTAFINDSLYEDIIKSEPVKVAINLLEKIGKQPVIKHGVGLVNCFGRLFINACVAEHNDVVSSSNDDSKSQSESQNSSDV